MMKDIQCLKCGTLLLSGGCIQELCEKIAVKDDFSLAEFIVGCPNCSAQFGVVVASDSVGLMILFVPPSKTHQCFEELEQMLKEGLSIAAISQIVNNARKPQYISFL
jgi:hypothetical protein